MKWWDKEHGSGCKHGAVRASRIHHPIPETRYVNRVESPTGSFTWVSSSKPKLTCKCCGQPQCNGCHLRPPWKAKDKTKGTHKLKSNGTVFKDLLSGFSATTILDLLDRQLFSSYETDEDDDEEEEVDRDYLYDI
ncbi:uncharacterized protein LOC133813882 [Humulus lupulus]|uniref:uncharacterized protein LOC133813882 n=1 Tax=Humulus lupulus TaxID=3486 RepID=UPI002B4174B7|nr:uncharacterized protein LOC133813882 [Humulus lupulus]